MSFDLVRPAIRPILLPVFEFAASSLSGKPKLVTPPVVYGDPWVGHQLITTAGTWTGQPAPEVMYEWLKDGVVIPNENKAVYTIVAPDLGSNISSKITCTNPNGTASSKSNEITIVVQRSALRSDVEDIRRGYDNNDRSVYLKEGAFAVSNASQRSGKAYYEVVVDDTYTEGNTFIGIASSHNGVISTEGYVVYHKGKLVASIPASDNNSWRGVVIESGDIIGISVDLDECTIGFSVNGYLKGTQRVPNIRNHLPMSAFVGSEQGTLNSIRYTFSGEKSQQMYKPNEGYTDWVGQTIEESAPTFVTVPQLQTKAFNDDTLTPTGVTTNACPNAELSYAWYANNVRIPHAIGGHYLVEFDYINQTITCEVTATNYLGSVKHRSNECLISRAHVAPVSKAMVYLHTDAESNYAGELYTVSESEWSGWPEPYVDYEWFLNNEKIGGADANCYQTSREDYDKRLMCKVTGRNDKWYYSIYTAKLKLLEPLSVPYTIEKPELSGGDQAGALLTVTKGKWKGNPIPVIEYSWFSDGTRIPNESKDVYQSTILDIGVSIHAEIAATNSQGMGVAILDPILIRKADKLPYYTMSPMINGSAVIGSDISTTFGEWTGNPTPTFEITWWKNDEVIKGENTLKYRVRDTDLHSSISVTVKATNCVGSVIAKSLNRLMVQSPPKCISLPKIRGRATVGSTMVPDTGVWEGTPTPHFDYSWKIDDATIALNCPYTLKANDIGKQLTLVILATNAYGREVAESTSVVIESMPVNIRSPILSGYGVLSVTNGEWIGYPEPTFKYEWFRNKKLIANARESVYQTIDLDIGCEIIARVRSSNNIRSTIADSNPIMVHSKPLGLGSPYITVEDGIAKVVNTDWLAYPAPTFTYLWNGYDNDTEIMSITKEMVGQSISCTITAMNSEGSTLMTAEQVLVLGAPECDIAPKIVCNDHVLSVITGKWFGYPYPQFSYSWSRNGVPLPNEFRSEYLAMSTDAGCDFVVRVRAANELGEEVVFTDTYTVYKEPIKLTKEFYTVSFQDCIRATITYTPAVSRVLDALHVEYNTDDTSVFIDPSSIVVKPANIIYAVVKKNVSSINIDDILEFTNTLKETNGH